MKTQNGKWRFAMHVGPHVDEFGGAWLFSVFGRKMFPGIEGATIWAVSENEYAKFCRGRTEQQVRDEEGVIAIGIGGGAFDEHGRNGEGRKSGTSAILKVAEFLGVADDPTIIRTLEYVTENDDEGGATEFELPEIVKDLNRSTFKNNPNGLYHLVSKIFEGKRARQLAYVRAQKMAEGIQPVRLNEGITAIRLDLVGQEDSEMVHSHLLRKADVVVVRRPTGHIQIYTRKGQIDLDNVADGIRYGELKARRLNVPRDADLGADGTLDCVPNWHYQQRAGWMFNGSLSHPDQEVTALSLEYVCEMVRDRVRRIQRRPKVFGPTVIPTNEREKQTAVA